MMSNNPKQLSLFDQNTIDDERPLPLIVAERWDFPVQHHIHDGQLWYSVIDWIAGLFESSIQEKKTRNYIARIKRTLVFSKNQWFSNPSDDLPESLYACDKGLYLITQSMRNRKDTPTKAIKEYLAESGAFADEVRRNPEKAIEQIESYAGMKRKRQIDRYVHAGYGEHPEVKRLQMRDTNIATFKSLKQSIARVCENPQWGRLINAEYEDLFGEVTSTLKTLLETDNIRDALQMPQLTALTFAEQGLKVILDNRREMSNDDIRRAIEVTFVPIGQTLREICMYAGVNPITNQALLEVQS